MTATPFMTEEGFSVFTEMLEPGVEDSPTGFRVSDSKAAEIKEGAAFILTQGFPLLDSFGRGDAHQHYKEAAFDFALATMALVADRRTRVADVKKFWKAQPWWKRWLRHLPSRSKENTCRLSEEQVTGLEEDAAAALQDALPTFETLPRFTSFEGYVAGTKLFALAALHLANDRERLIADACGASRPSFRDGLRLKHQKEDEEVLRGNG